MKKLTEENIKNNTFWSNRYYEERKEEIEEYEQDSYKEQRLKFQECKTCFYLKNKIALQAFTKYKCKNCEEEQIHHNSNVPRYCKKCAKEHNVCVRCGGEL